MEITELFLWVEAHLNYFWITVLMAIESSFIPFPSEVVVPPAAYFACTEGSNLNIYLVVVFATLGALIGALVNYYLAVWIGRPLVYKFANSRFGHMCLIDEAKVVKAEQYFDKHGAISTFIGRLIPAVRQLISIPAGLARMNLAKFVLYTSLGAGVWNIVLASLGYWLSTFIPKDQLYAQIEHYNQYLTYFGYGIGVVVVLFILYNAFKKKK
jgi:membrane protein DedA with SNARE-associated domain